MNSELSDHRAGREIIPDSLLNQCESVNSDWNLLFFVIHMLTSISFKTAYFDAKETIHPLSKRILFNEASKERDDFIQMNSRFLITPGTDIE